MKQPIQLQEDLRALQQTSPLVVCLTNQVAMDFTANLLLAAGASPIMSAASQEASDLVRQAHALLLNIGTVNEAQFDTMTAMGQTFFFYPRPIVLDPVGIGVSTYREECVWSLINACHPTIIRGNASEIATLAGCPCSCRGVESTLTPEKVLPFAQQKARDLHCIIVISGETDYITDGSRTETIAHGSSLMTRVTAMGCAESALMAAFAAVQPDPFRAALSTMTLMGLAGEQAAAITQEPGTYRQVFLDQLYHLSHSY